MTPDEQLALWVAGRSIHNDDPSRGEGGECCPDFSCCNGPQAPYRERLAFQEIVRAGDQAAKMSMLGTFLSRMVAESLGEEKARGVYIADGTGGVEPS